MNLYFAIGREREKNFKILWSQDAQAAVCFQNATTGKLDGG
jgi:hypothetical protein